ncbi:nucleotidyltransferase family protein [Burkholderia plantarii]|uniref:nucleotidyltransferase family protein n=1 Tax=Burkholderia plantarii TaxID=41899 RepID=UPI0014956C01|nr:nucleotidyltransferase family protein [Burkholderia plantarii]
MTPHLSKLTRLRIDGLYYLASGDISCQQTIYDKIWSIQRAHLVDFIKKMAETGVLCWTFKGAEIAERWYSSRPIGVFSDVDIIVERKNLGVVKSMLFSEGFRQSIFDFERESLVDDDVLELGAIESRHYELGKFCKLVKIDVDLESLRYMYGSRTYPLVRVGGEVFLCLAFDVHHGVANDIDVNDVISDSVPSAFGIGVTVNPTRLLWILTSRYYMEVAITGKRSLRDFSYLLPLLKECEIDWDHILGMNYKYSLFSSLYFYFCFMDRIIPGKIPSSVLDKINPVRSGFRGANFGWQLNTLLGEIDPFPLSCL